MIHRHSFIAFLVAFIIRIKYIETKQRNQSKKKTLIIYCIIIAFRIIPIIERSNHHKATYTLINHISSPTRLKTSAPTPIPTAQPISINIFIISHIYIYIQYTISCIWRIVNLDAEIQTNYFLYNINKSTAGFIVFPFLLCVCVGVGECVCVREGSVRVCVEALHQLAK